MDNIINILKLNHATRQLRKKNAFIPRGGGLGRHGVLIYIYIPPHIFPQNSKKPKKARNREFRQNGMETGVIF